MCVCVCVCVCVVCVCACVIAYKIICDSTSVKSLTRSRHVLCNI